VCGIATAVRAQEEGEEGEKEKVSPAVAALRAKADTMWELAMGKYGEACEAKNPRVAEQLTRDVVALFDAIVKLGKDSGKYGIARFNAAVVVQESGKQGEVDALRRFAELIGSDVDDTDPSGELMRPFRNYRFHAWRRSMAIHRRRGQTFVALDALFHSRAAFVTHCRTCHADMAAGFRRTLDAMCLDVLHGADRKDVEEARITADQEIVQAALADAKDARSFLTGLADRLEEKGRAQDAEKVRKLVPPAAPGKPASSEAGADGKRGASKR
jgi:hypothetical protein